MGVDSAKLVSFRSDVGVREAAALSSDLALSVAREALMLAASALLDCGFATLPLAPGSSLPEVALRRRKTGNVVSDRGVLSPLIGSWGEVYAERVSRFAVHWNGESRMKPYSRHA